ncbi:MAG: tyrosine-type recombinase/integrase [Boseongicola sp. SB0677_bin_26]|nr:tyrosine-type recombinase/integrase [Boseongicola sp. SB0677_bin_26]
MAFYDLFVQFPRTCGASLGAGLARQHCTTHQLLHTFASRALALGETLPVIGKLLRHSDIETTARYAHLAQASIHQTAERIAKSIAGYVQ